MDIENEYLCDEHVEVNFWAEILQSKYGKVSVNKVAEMKRHLTQDQ